MEDKANNLFIEAVALTQKDFYIDGMQNFFEVVRLYPESDVADDALFNAGLCHFHMNSFNAAIKIFNTVINDYPQGQIYTYGSHREFGETAAKCHYAIINCYLGLGNFQEASNELVKLKDYPDSYILSDLGEKITFLSLAEKALETYSQFNIK